MGLIRLKLKEINPRWYAEIQKAEDEVYVDWIYPVFHQCAVLSGCKEWSAVCWSIFERE
jgi:hypothetical protein